MNNYFKKYLKYKQKYYNLKYGGENGKKLSIYKELINKLHRTIINKVSEKDVAKGAFGTVSIGPLLKCAVEEKECLKVYAIKKILISKISTAKDIEREIKILEILKEHPNIIKLYNYIKEDLQYKLFFEYALNGTLNKNINDLKNYQQKVFILYQLLKGVLFIHENNIIHLDLKPANILLSFIQEFPILQIADFGLSNFIKKAGIDIKGTPYYLYPKKVAEKNSKINDKWACGLIIYYLFSNGKILYTELFPNIKNITLFINNLRGQDKNIFINNIQNNKNIDNFIKDIIIKLFNNENLNDILDLIYKKLDKRYKNKIKEMYSSYKLKVQGINKKKDRKKWRPPIDPFKLIEKKDRKKWRDPIDPFKSNLVISNNEINPNKKTIIKNNLVNPDNKTIIKNNLVNPDNKTIIKNNLVNPDNKTIIKNNLVNPDNETIKKE